MHIVTIKTLRNNICVAFYYFYNDMRYSKIHPPKFLMLSQ